jgi:tRNA(Ile)-lysidine synthase
VPDVTRNKIRLQLLPMLQAISPAAVKNIEATAHHLAEADKVYQTAIGKALSTVVADPETACLSDDTIMCQTVSIPKLLEQPSPESVLFELMHPWGFTSAQVYDALRMLHGSPGHLVSSSTHHLLIDRDKLLIEQRCSTALPNKYGCNGSMLVEGKGTVLADKAPLSIPEPGTYVYDGRRRLRVTVSDGASISRDAEVATLDAAKVTFPLVLRPVAAGDRFVPFGMKGSRLVSDYLTDRKLTLFDKWRQLAVVAADGNIIWLVGQRTDNRYRINAKTSSTLTLQLVKAE